LQIQQATNCCLSGGAKSAGGYEQPPPPSAGADCTLKGVLRVGLLAKNILLKSDKEVFFILFFFQ
jgi:hypothetical protein